MTGCLKLRLFVSAIAAADIPIIIVLGIASPASPTVRGPAAPIIIAAGGTIPHSIIHAVPGSHRCAVAVDILAA